MTAIFEGAKYAQWEPLGRKAIDARHGRLRAADLLQGAAPHMRQMPAGGSNRPPKRGRGDWGDRGWEEHGEW